MSLCMPFHSNFARILDDLDIRKYEHGAFLQPTYILFSISYRLLPPESSHNHMMSNVAEIFGQGS